MKDDSQLDLSQAILLDFGQIFIALNDKVKYYLDLSNTGDYTEAINNLYDSLRWAELREDAKYVLITNFKEVDTQGKGLEHRDALFDRVFRATSGREL